MPLTQSDIRRIMKAGYSLGGFAVKTREGWRLKNRSGRCVFLSGGRCIIYPIRPEGCRLYPLVYDEASGTARLDDLCPYREEFEATDRDIGRLNDLLRRLAEEGGRRHRPGSEKHQTYN
ncbi:MAG: putative Fe-S-cluster oxidoreductase [Candidatus Bathyarchaeota archaeon B63]|nr:MAG: putative Fe-S-cluster oxidoreductase [Candidatus Bathyarchaeota archaeon B63]